MREANDRGYECLLIEDATESYFPEFKAATLEDDPRPGRHRRLDRAVRRAPRLALAGLVDRENAGAAAGRGARASRARSESRRQASHAGAPGAPAPAPRRRPHSRDPLAAVAPVPAGQALLPEPVVAERLVAAPLAFALGQVRGAPELARAGNSTRRRNALGRARARRPRGRAEPPARSARDRARDPHDRHHCGALRSPYTPAACASAIWSGCSAAARRSLALARRRRPGGEPSGCARRRDGDAAPGGGIFERFGVESLPIVAPVNARGRGGVLRHARPRRRATKGIFLSSRGRVTAVAREGDAVPGGGRLSGFGRHPSRRSTTTGTVVFAAAVAGGRAVEGIFAARNGRIQAVRSAGARRPASLRRARQPRRAGDQRPRRRRVPGDRAPRTGDARGGAALPPGGQLRKVVAQGDPAPAGGTFAGFGPPASIATARSRSPRSSRAGRCPAASSSGAAGQLRMVVGAGDETPIGGIFAKFSERSASATQGTIAFHGHAEGRAGRRRRSSPSRTGAPRWSRGSATRRPGGGTLFELRTRGRRSARGRGRVHGLGGRRAEPGHRVLVAGDGPAARGRRRRRAARRRRASPRSLCCRS